MTAVFDKAVGGGFGTPSFGAAAAPSTMFGKPLLGSSAPRECVFNAALCCYTSVSPDDVLIGCRGEDELLCVHTRYCLASGDKAFPVSLECSPEEIMRNRGGTVCELSLAAAALKVKMPSTLYRHHDRFFCLRSAGAFPLQDPVPTPVCAFCCCRVLPRPMGPLAPPLGGKPTTNLIMRR